MVGSKKINLVTPYKSAQSRFILGIIKTKYRSIIKFCADTGISRQTVYNWIRDGVPLSSIENAANKIFRVPPESLNYQAFKALQKATIKPYKEYIESVQHRYPEAYQYAAKGEMPK